MYDFMFAPEQTRTVNWRTMLQFSTTIQRWLLGSIPQQVQDLERITAAWRPDVVVTEQNMWAPMLILREKNKIPVAVLAYFSCMIPGPDAPPFGMGLPGPRNWYTRLLSKSVWMATAPFRAGFRRAANEIRQRYGLPRLKTSVLEFTGTMPLYLVMGTSEFDYERKDLPPSVHYVGACLWDKLRHEKTSDWLEQLPKNQPWVHASEGTVHVVSPFVLSAAAQGLANLPMQVILTTGGNREPSELDLGPIAPNVHLVRWVSHTELLPHLDVMITTGGSATVQTTLKSRGAVDYCPDGMGQTGHRAPGRGDRRGHSTGARTMHAEEPARGRGTGAWHALISPKRPAHGGRFRQIWGTAGRRRPPGKTSGEQIPS